MNQSILQTWQPSSTVFFACQFSVKFHTLREGILLGDSGLILYLKNLTMYVKKWGEEKGHLGKHTQLGVYPRALTLSTI